MPQHTKSRTGQRILRSLLLPIEKFLQLEVASGLILLVVTLATLILANSPWAVFYHQIQKMPLVIQLGETSLNMPLQTWINDGLMTFFFLVVGLEIKRELLVGELASPRRAALPLFGALGGMICPALIYHFFNSSNDGSNGWAIPMATDIAFAVGILSLRGKGIPFSLKVLLLALAIIDDLGAIIVIGLFYSHDFYAHALIWTSLGVLSFLFLRFVGVRHALPYIVLGVMMWFGLLKSGIHASMAGVLIGILTPLKKNEPSQISPLEYLVQLLHPWVTFIIMPLFAFFNAGVTLSQINLWEFILHPVSQGIIFGLFLGKPLGILSFSYLALRLKLAQLPAGLNWHHMICMGCLGGIGFTMALFISHLALNVPAIEDYSKLSILLGSLISALLGLLLLSLPRKNVKATV